MKRTAFTMIELIFVIVVLGILSAIAIPRLGSSVTDAHIAKGRSDVAAIRSAIISERQTRLLQGNITYTSQLDDATTAAGQTLFDGNATAPLLQYGIISASGDGKWMKTETGYEFKVNGVGVAFTYTQASGAFDCDHSVADCKLLTE